MPIDQETWEESDKLVYQALLNCFPNWRTRPKLVEETKIPRTTVYDALDRLEKRGLVEMDKEIRHTRGRPKTFFRMPVKAYHKYELEEEENDGEIF